MSGRERQLVALDEHGLGGHAPVPAIAPAAADDDDLATILERSRAEAGDLEDRQLQEAITASLHEQPRAAKRLRSFSENTRPDGKADVVDLTLED